MNTNKDIEIRPQEGFQMSFASSNVDVVFGGGNLGGGKEMPLNAKILTPSGWQTMGDMQVGSKVMTPFDGIATVIAVFPQGVKDVYELTTLDGRKCECGLEHLWTVRTPKQVHKYRSHNKEWGWTMTLQTKDLIDGLSQGKKYFIPNNKAIEFGEKELPIPPYVLGVMLGDGCLTKSCRSNSHCFVISNSEKDIIEKVARLSDTIHTREDITNYNKYFFSPHNDDYWNYIDNAGLSTYSYNKFIPEDYLFASIKQRKELLAGLFDTDGNIEPYDNSYSFSTTSVRLKDTFIELCRSLGYTCSCREDRREKYTKGVAYDIVIRTDDIIFTSEKHKARYNNERNKTRKYARSNDHSRIVSIKKVRRAECQCILVDDEKHLYITDDYITTHNSYGLVLAMAEPLMTDPDFRAMISRRSLGNQKAGGGFVEKFKQIFGADFVKVRESENPRVTFPNGTFVDLTYLDDSNMDKLRERAKGWEYDLIAIDELTEMTWEVFSYVMTRNRGQSKTFTGKFFATLNPKRSHWTRIFLDWYIGSDGFIIPERDGVVRYFYCAGPTVKDVVWGMSKREVYEKCKIDIDRKLKTIGGNFGYEVMIKSFVFYQGKLGSNKKMLENNSGYLGSVAASGGRMAQALMEGNFNVDPEEDEDIPIPSQAARDCFVKDPAVNGDKWITIDLADYGKDNTLMLSWNGFHVVNYEIVMHSTPRINAERARLFAASEGVAESHIIYDATAGRYFNDYIPDAIPYISAAKAMGIYYLSAMTIKDLCYLRLSYMIKRGQLTFSDKVANAVYTHQNLKYRVSIQNEFMEECAVVRFDKMQSGKKKLQSKKEMNRNLGKDRSMDLLDPCAMRMYPCLNMEYGSELQEGFRLAAQDVEEKNPNAQSIYDDTLYY